MLPYLSSTLRSSARASGAAPSTRARSTALWASPAGAQGAERSPGAPGAGSPSDEPLWRREEDLPENEK